MAAAQKRRTGDQWWVRAVRVVVFTFTPMAVGMTVYVFSNFAKIDYVDAENRKQELLTTERLKNIQQSQEQIVIILERVEKKVDDNTTTIRAEIIRDRDRYERLK